jgi:hypothetical protein
MFAALLLGTAVLLGSLLCYCLATALIVPLVARLLRARHTGLGLWKNVTVMMIVSLVTAVPHLIQIALWAVVYRAVGEVSTFETAFYYSAENYTALGYGDILLSERWRLLGPLEAVDGLLLFGLSTAVMFAVISRLIRDHLHPQRGDPAAVNQEGAGAAGGGGPQPAHEEVGGGKARTDGVGEESR